MFDAQADLFTPARVINAQKSAQPWKPMALDREQWPPDYVGVFAWRIETLLKLRNDPSMLASAHAYYSTRPGEWIMHWCDTYNPRKSDMRWMPFVFFKRQDEFVQFLEELRRDQENGLVEKCRDIGATWLVCAYSVWCWIFLDDFAFGWGSRKQELVDKLGDPDSIFEKMRLIIKRLPDVWLPDGFKTRDHATFMKLINPENGSTITGESGDNIGRGGRKAMYGKDESAHYERPEKIEAALGDNTNVQLDISSVNGLGNVFHRRREAGVDWHPGAAIEKGFTRVFVFDWKDHPEKTQEWYDQRKAKAEREGMQHVFAQEVDRNYSAAVLNTIIPYEWTVSAVDAHLIIPQLRDIPSVWGAALDVADGGIDRNALCKREFVVVRHLSEWGMPDPGETTRHTIDECEQHPGIVVEYDCIGVGVSVKSEYNRLVKAKTLDPSKMRFNAWNAGAGVVNPKYHVIEDDDDSPTNEKFFGNFKAQAWWSMRTRLYKTDRVVQAIKAGNIPPYYPADELISFDSRIPLLAKLQKELAQVVRGKHALTLKMIIDKQPEGTLSPNLADATVMCMFPAPDTAGDVLIGRMNG